MTPGQERYAGAVMNTFGPPKLVLARGEGAHVWDDDGKEYLDLLGGIAVNALGHAHPALVEAVTTQLADARPRLQLLRHRAAGAPRRAAARPARAPPGRVFFTNSGAEANEAALKLTRRTGRTHLVAAEGALPRAHHGRAGADLQGRLPRAVRAAARRRHLRAVRRRGRARRRRHRRDRRRRPRADPGRGRRRRRRPPATSPAARRITRDHGALLWLDEVQTGIGRTGAGSPTSCRRRRRRRPTSSPSPRAWAAASRSAPAVALGDAGDAAPARQPRHHLRRQPGRLRGRARRARHHRGATGCSTHVDRRSASASRDGARRRPAGVTEVRGHGPDARRSTSTPTTPPAVVDAGRDAGFIAQRHRPRHGCGFVPPLVITDADVDAFARRLRPAILDERPRRRRERPHDAPLPRATTTSPRPSSPRSSTSPTGSRPTRSTTARSPARGRSPWSSTARPCAPRCRSPPASPSSAATR